MRTKQSIQEQISNLYLLPNQTEDAQNEQVKFLSLKLKRFFLFYISFKGLSIYK